MLYPALKRVISVRDTRPSAYYNCRAERTAVPDIICPDNETSEKMDQARMAWSSSDVAQNRSALSRWDKEYKEEFEAFMKERVD
jgi:hypothetical protein